MSGRSLRGPASSRRTIVVALASNVLVAAAKLVTGLATGSAAMLAEAAHSVADSMNEGVLLLSLALGRRPPDDDHPFGHGKEHFFWPFIAAISIFVTGAVFSITEGVLALTRHAAVTDSPLPAYAVLAVALVTESASLVTAFRQLRGGAQRTRVPLGEFVVENRDPAPRIVLLEDSAAVIGIGLAAAGLALRQATGNPAWDAAASIAIGVLLAGVAVAVGADAKDLLLGQSARPDVRRALAERVERQPEVAAVPALRTMHLAPDRLLVAARLVLRPGLELAEAERVLQRIERELGEADPAVADVFLYPVADAAAAGLAPTGDGYRRAHG